MVAIPFLKPMWHLFFRGDMGSALLSLWFCTQLLFSVPVVVSGALIVTLQNLVAISGQRLEIQCQTDSGKKLKWFSQLPGSSNEEQIYSGFRFPPHAAHLYTTSNSSDGKQFIRFNASVDTARRYTCLEPGSLEVGSAEVIVLESNPGCNATRDNEYVNITCAIDFHGNWIPQMDWTRCNNDTLIIGDVSNSISPNDRISSTLTVRLNGNDNGACFRLTMMFSETERPWGTTANNTPSYNHTICFKDPDWNDTVDCTAAQTNNSNVFSSMPTEEDIDHTKFIIFTAITTILIVIAVLGFVLGLCWYIRRRRRRRKTRYINGTSRLMQTTSPNYNQNGKSLLPS